MSQVINSQVHTENNYTTEYSEKDKRTIRRRERNEKRECVFEPIPDKKAVWLGKNAVYFEDQEVYEDFVSAYMKKNINRHIEAIGDNILPLEVEVVSKKDYLESAPVLMELNRILGTAALHADRKQDGIAENRYSYFQ